MPHIRLTLIDVMTAAVAGLLLAAMMIPTIVSTRSVASWEKCGSNLRQIGQALLLYANANKGSYPRTRAAPDAPVTQYTGVGATDPFSDNGPGPNDVTAALFLLVRAQQVDPSAFVCPTTSATVWDFGGPDRTAADVANFPSERHLSYSFMHPYPPKAVIESGYRFNVNLISAEFAVAADLNPGGATLLRVTPSSPLREMRSANTRNHDRSGQMVLYGDGHTEKIEHPFGGIQRDNIYTYRAGPADGQQPGPSAGISGPPFDAHDAVLLPAATLDPHTWGAPTDPDDDIPWGAWMLAAIVLIGLAIGGALYARHSREARRRETPTDESGAAPTGA